MQRVRHFKRQTDLNSGDRWISVGCVGFGGPLPPYFDALNAVEYPQTFFVPPRDKVLRKLRESAPNGFRFFVKAWQLVTHPHDSPGYRRLVDPLDGPPAHYGLFQPTDEVADAWRATVRAADLLDAAGVLFETPATFTPSARNRNNLSAFFEKVERNGRWMVWDPRGLWQTDEVAAICDDLDLVPCLDPTDGEVPRPAQRAYFKVRGLGQMQRFDLTRALDLADILRFFPEVVCIFGTSNMFFDARRLTDAVADVDDEPRDAEAPSYLSPDDDGEVDDDLDAPSEG